MGSLHAPGNPARNGVGEWGVGMSPECLAEIDDGEEEQLTSLALASNHIRAPNELSGSDPLDLLRP
jgi:hypothetical protein